MNRTPVESSNIISVGYDPETSTLEVEFSSGVYQYADVPEAAHRELVNAPSIGFYFYRNIRNAYRPRKVSE